MKILGLELGLPEAPLWGPWGMTWRSVPPVLSWSLQRVNSHPGWLPASLFLSSGWAGWWEGGQPCALWAGMGVGRETPLFSCRMLPQSQAPSDQSRPMLWA